MTEFDTAADAFSDNKPNVSAPNIGIPQTPMTGNTHISNANTTVTTNSGAVKIPKLRHYPKFNGTLDKWRGFRHLLCY